MRYLHLVPKKHLSRLTGLIVHLPLPKPLSHWSVKQFAKAFDINVEEAEFPIEAYPSMGDFFIRRIKMNTRPLGEGKILHCADSVITQAGIIRGSKLIQAKGKSFTVEGLLGGLSGAEKFEGGAFATYYLCPTDYHRVHSPVTGEIVRYHHVPGALWPVNAWSVMNIDNLFGINERVAVEIETTHGRAIAVFVGATNVGQISLAFDSKFRTNTSQTEPETTVPPTPIPILKGDELGVFHMGSTVVLLLEKSFGVTESTLAGLVGKPVKVRSSFL